ncbi:hypothetical protein BCR43DRAFT_444739, partial [Syncephalastrum racemosum]
GFHDIAAIFLLIFGEETAATLLERVALFFTRGKWLRYMDCILQELTMIPTLLQQEDQDLYTCITETGVLPYYCLSQVLTWFSHDLHDLRKIKRFFDFFLCSNPLMPIYASAAVVLIRRDELLTMRDEMDVMHSFLSKVPQDLDVEAVIQKSRELEERCPVLELQTESAVALHRVSAANTYDTLWVALETESSQDSKAKGEDEKDDKAEMTENLKACTAEAVRIVAMDPKERLPMALPPPRNKEAAQKSGTVFEQLKQAVGTEKRVLTLVAVSVGMVSLAMWLASNDLLM